MKTQILDRYIAKIKEVEDKISTLTEKKDALRTELFGILEKAEMGQYKNERATVSYVEKKRVTIKDETSLLQQLKSQQIVKYFTVVPKHEELNETFLDDVKNGVFTTDLAEVTTTKNLSIRFIK